MSVVLKFEREDYDAAEAEARFAEYCALAVKAQTSLKVEDGIAAGKAWGRFLHMFERRPHAKGVRT